MAYLYAIGKEKDLTAPYDRCYIGVTIDLDRRWNNHVKSKYRVGKYIRKYKLNRSNMIVIAETDEDKCFELENFFRPSSNMGLNEAIGGFGGYTKYDEKRNKKISKANKGRIFTEEHKSNISKSRVGVYVGGKNANAKKWKLISNTGKIYNIDGNLNETCEKLKLLPSTLRYYINRIVPNIETGYGRI